jgi:hypothetical protein
MSARPPTILRLRVYALERLLRAAEGLLPAVAAALPPDRAARARWGFRHLKDALENAGPEGVGHD